MKRTLAIAGLLFTAYELYRLIRWYRSIDFQLDFTERAISGR